MGSNRLLTRVINKMPLARGHGDGKGRGIGGLGSNRSLTRVINEMALARGGGDGEGRGNGVWGAIDR